MSKPPRQGRNDLNAEPEEPCEYASPPCYQHDLDPNYLGTAGREENEQPSTSSWADVRAWRIQTRSRLIALREGLTDDGCTRCAEAIVKHLADAKILSGHQRVGFFWPMAGEIDLRPMMAELTSQGVKAALPVITKPQQPLEFWLWQPGDTLDESGPWGIPTPARRRLVDVTALLIPLVGFADQGHRLGHGGGYYDRTLATVERRPLTIGIGLEACRLPTIFPQEHDIAMDIIVTDAGVYRGKANCAGSIL